jgi:hypothetical protein
LSVLVEPIELPRDRMRFVKAWWPIHEGDTHWVPPLLAERKEFFDPRRNPYFRTATVKCFLATRDGNPVGTISATVDHRVQEQEPGVGLIGFFEFVDDEEVARALLDAATGWLRAQGMKKVRGPFNFNSNHEFGLLVDGFDTDPCFMNPHNPAYHGPIYERLGFRKQVDWYAYWMDKGPIPQRVKHVRDRILTRNKDITLRKADLRHFDREVALFFEIYNDAWEDNWGHVRLAREEIDFIAKGFRQVVNPDLAWFAYVGDEVAGAVIVFEDFNQVAKKMNGRIIPFGWWHFLFGRKKIDALRIFILGVKTKFQHLPLGAPLYVQIWEEGLKLPIRGAEASLVLEDNHRMRGALEKLGARVYKTYRTYEKDI